MKKITRILLVFVCVILLAASCNTNQKPANQPTNIDQQSSVQPGLKVFSYRGVKGENALTLLKSMYKVETKDFGKDLGEFVESINDIKPAKDEFWAFYINGKSSQVGASQYTTNEEDLIEWKLEKINNYK